MENKELSWEITIYSLAETSTDRSYVFKSNQKAGKKQIGSVGGPGRTPREKATVEQSTY